VGGPRGARGQWAQSASESASEVAGEEEGDLESDTEWLEGEAGAVQGWEGEGSFSDGQGYGGTSWLDDEQNSGVADWESDSDLDELNEGPLVPTGGRAALEGTRVQEVSGRGREGQAAGRGLHCGRCRGEEGGCQRR